MRSLLFFALGACSLPAVVAAQQVAPPPPPGAPQPQRTTTRAEAIAMAERRFAAADTDGNGLLTQAERHVEREAMRARMAPPPRDPMARPDRPLADGEAAPRRPMREDANPDGVVTRAEYVERAAKRFDRIDANHDGRLDPGEAPMRMEGRRLPPPPAGAI